MNLYITIPCTYATLQEVKKLDDTFYGCSLDLEWYIDRYLNKNSCILLYDNDKLIGYFMAVPVKRKLYKAICRGITAGDIDLNHDLFVKKSRYYYLASVIIDSEYRGQGLGTFLAEKFFTDFKPRHWCAITVSKGGSALLKERTNKFKQVNDKIIYYK